MKKGKYSNSRSSKPIALVLALVLLLGVAIGGTIAWLTDSTGTVTNTFTTSDIKIDLKESEDLNLKMVPGCAITKDPKVTVDATSEDCYLFVKITKGDTFDAYFEEYEVDPAWTALEGYEGVYYIDNPAKGTAIPVLKNNKVIVSDDVTKTMMENINNGTTAAPTLGFTAYAIQKANGTAADGTTTNFTVEQAWDEISGT